MEMSSRDKRRNQLPKLNTIIGKAPTQGHFSRGLLSIENDILPRANALNVGDTVVVQRPVITASGSVSFAKSKAKVLAKYPHHFMVEDINLFGSHNVHKRRWCIQYVDLFGMSWDGRAHFADSEPV